MLNWIAIWGGIWLFGLGGPLQSHAQRDVPVSNDIVEDDGKPDPRFAATPEDLKKKGVEDFQLYYALNTIKRLSAPATIASAAAAKKSR